MQRTPLDGWHREANARMVEFAGWDMPLQFSGIQDEHLAVRRTAGVFDLCHMAEIAVFGPDAAKTMNHIMANDPDRIADDKAQYSFVMNDQGGIVDDVIVFRQATQFLLVVNAASRKNVLTHVQRYAVGVTHVEDQSDSTGLIALQGPKAVELVGSILGSAITQLPSFGWMKTAWNESELMVSRTGYTGEDGVELMLDWKHTSSLWKGLIADGQTFGVKPCGLGARDTLRLEARLPLYGHDISSSTTPIEAGMKRFVVLEGRDFLGSRILREQVERGVERKLIGFYLEGRQIPRPGYSLYVDKQRVGTVTSGTLAPALNRGIGLAYVPPEAAAAGSLQLDVRGKRIPVTVHKGSFLKLQNVD